MLSGIAAFAVRPISSDDAGDLLGTWRFYFTFPDATEEVDLHFQPFRRGHIQHRSPIRAALTYRMTGDGISVSGEFYESDAISNLPLPSTLVLRAHYDDLIQRYVGMAMFIGETLDPTQPLGRATLVVPVSVQPRRRPT